MGGGEEKTGVVNLVTRSSNMAEVTDPSQLTVILNSEQSLNSLKSENSSLIGTIAIYLVRLYVC